MTQNRVLLIVLDGIGDWPGALPGGRTPLEAAETPVLDRLARDGRCGLLDPVPHGMRPGSDTAHLLLLGYDPARLRLRRGPLEALGCGLVLDADSVAFRINFATADDGGRLTDRRAGRIRDTAALCRTLGDGIDLSAFGCTCTVAPGTGHRGALAIHGRGLGEEVSANEPPAPGSRPPPVSPLTGSPADRKTAAAANEAIRQAGAILAGHPVNRARAACGLAPANMLLLRGAGRMRFPEPFAERYGCSGAVAAEAALVRGIGRALGMAVLPSPDLSAAALVGAAMDALDDHPFVLVNLKGADDAGHDGDPVAKRDAIAAIDRALRGVAARGDCTVVVCGDHSTPCAVGDHTHDPVPLLVRGGNIPADAVRTFGERACAAGSLGRIGGADLPPLLRGLFGKTDKARE